MAANRFGIDLGEVYAQQNALADQSQRRQLNALALQKGQMDLENAPALNALALQNAKLGVEEKKTNIAGQTQAQDLARHAADVKETTDTLGALDAVPDEQLPQATAAARAGLAVRGITTAALDQALQQSAGDPAKLRPLLKQAAQAGLGYAAQLQQKNADRTFEATQENTKATREQTAAYRNATLAQGNERLRQGQERLNQANAPSDSATVSSYGDEILDGNAQLQNVPAKDRPAVVRYMHEQINATTPLGASRATIASNRITEPFRKLPQYELTANGLPYLQRIDAAMKTPGSVSDQDLLDSLTKLNTAGNAISDAQVKLITDGKSFSDTMGTFANKFKNGGVLSDNQRKQIQEIAKNIFANYKKGYQPVYDQATAQLKAAGIKPQFWTIPDLNKLSDQAGLSDAATQSKGAVTVGTTAKGADGSRVQWNGSAWVPLQARAAGGPVTAGQPYLVGERGPEVVTPQQSGNVSPNDPLRPALEQHVAQGGSIASFLQALMGSQAPDKTLGVQRPAPNDPLRAMIPPSIAKSMAR